MMCQSNYLEVSRAALMKNASALVAAVKVPVIGVVKCDGYGVSLPEAAKAWLAAGATMLAVSRPEEALALRRQGFSEDILLLSPVADEVTLAQLLEDRVILTVSGLENAWFYSMAGKGPIRVHVAIDTGMARFGIRWEDVEQAKAVYQVPGLIFEGIFSHFACAFEEEYSITRKQLSRFLQVTQALQAAGCPVGIRHIANSCAALRFPQTRLDAVRIGSGLVGRLPAAVPVALERVGSFYARVVDLKYLQKGDATGYGSCCKIKKPTTAVVVALGTANGFGTCTVPEKLSLRHFASYLYQSFRRWRHPPRVRCNGQVLTVLGRVGNQFTLFEGANRQVKPGDWVQWDGDLMNCREERRFV